MWCDVFRAPQKTIWNPEPDGPSGPGTTKLVQNAPNPVPGSLAYPLDAAVAGDRLRDGLGRGRNPSPARNPSKSARSCLPESHLGCCSGGRKTKRRRTPGTTGRTGPTVGRVMQLRGGERRIRQLLQSKMARPGVAARGCAYRGSKALEKCRTP